MNKFFKLIAITVLSSLTLGCSTFVKGDSASPAYQTVYSYFGVDEYRVCDALRQSRFNRNFYSRGLYDPYGKSRFGLSYNRNSYNYYKRNSSRFGLSFDYLFNSTDSYGDIRREVRVYLNRNSRFQLKSDYLTVRRCYKRHANFY